jgi:hypothetical protein
MKVSLNRTLVDEALAVLNTDLAAFIEARQHKTLDEIWMDLRQATGVPFSVRTFYRWAEKLEVAS